MSNKAGFDRNMQVKRHQLFQPEETEFLQVLRQGLSTNYREVQVQFTTCPNLKEHPYHLASEGICGSPRLADVGGVPYLVPGPAAYRQRVYDLRHVCSQVDVPEGFVLGASACSKHFLGTNAELMPNSMHGFNNTHTARMVTGTEDPDAHTTERYHSTEFTLLGNLFISEGRIGRALHVRVKNRIGSKKSLISCMQKIIADHYGLTDDKIIGLGGCFVSLGKTRTKIHIMPDFSETPLNSDEDVANWLKFYETQAPVSHLSFSTSGDVTGFDIRTEHTHSFSGHGDGGHYHGDCNQDGADVEYEGYFSLCEFVYRIDQPQVTHLIGRD